MDLGLFFPQICLPTSKEMLQKHDKHTQKKEDFHQSGSKLMPYLGVIISALTTITFGIILKKCLDSYIPNIFSNSSAFECLPLYFSVKCSVIIP